MSTEKHTKVLFFCFKSTISSNNNEAGATNQ